MKRSNKLFAAIAPALFLATVVSAESLSPKVEAVASDFQSNVLPEWKSQIDAAAGKDLTIEWDWAKIVECSDRNMGPKKTYRKLWSIVYLDGLLDGFLRASKNLGETGKKEIMEHIDKVVFTCSSRSAAYSKKILCSNGVLTYDFAPENNTGSTDDRPKWRRQIHDNDLRAKAVLRTIENGECR